VVNKRWAGITRVGKRSFADESVYQGDADTMVLSTELKVALTAAAATIASVIITIVAQVRMARIQMQVDRERAGLSSLDKLHDNVVGFSHADRPGQARLVVLQNALID
jgi:hypothetical protein